MTHYILGGLMLAALVALIEFVRILRERRQRLEIMPDKVERCERCRVAHLNDYCPVAVIRWCPNCDTNRIATAEFACSVCKSRQLMPYTLSH